LPLAFIVTTIEDQRNSDFEIGLSVTSISLMLSVVLGTQLGSLASEYSKAQNLIQTIVSFSDQLRRSDVVDLILIARKPMKKSEFILIIPPEEATSMDERYKAYSDLFYISRSTHNSLSNTYIWWLILFACCFCVPASANNSENSGDLGWIVESMSIMVVFWAMYGIIKQYEDVLRPSNIWIYSSFNATQSMIRPVKWYERLFRPFIRTNELRADSTMQGVFVSGERRTRGNGQRA
jgi:hypothetical protein